MKLPGRRWVAAPLAAFVFLASGALPVLAETPQAAAPSVEAVAATAQPSVVGILNTMKANRSTDRARSAGTGFVFRDGVIITNAHVVENAAELKILYPDKTTENVSPSQIFADPVSDVAIVKVTKKGLKPLPFANSDKLAIGQRVVAIGNPLGFRLGNSVSAGILSGVGRALGSGYPFLQTDAPINPGNSGGPLFNLQGEVIGINSAKMSDFGVEGLGFAIPINTATTIAEQLMKEGKVERAVLGVRLNEGWEAYFGVPEAEGVTIANVIADGPAGLTALRPGDKLTRLDETPISTSDDVYAFLASKRPGDQVTITVKRQGQLLIAKVTLASQDALRKAAEEQGAEEGGILIGLTANQIQEAAEFGRKWATEYAEINPDYLAVSGSNLALLFTEYLYVARRIESAMEFGFNPGVGFQQAVADEIDGQIEIMFELQGERADFIEDARFTLSQAGRADLQGRLTGAPTYTTSPDGKVVISNLSVRFDSKGLNPAGEVRVTITTRDDKAIPFQFALKELR